MGPRRRFTTLLLLLLPAACSPGSAHDAGAQDAGATPDTHAEPDAGALLDVLPRADAGVDAASDVVVDARPLLAAMHDRGGGWQIYAGGGYRYGPSVIVYPDGSVDLWSCSPGAAGAWDFIRYRHSTDGGHTWSADQIALQPTPGTRDAFSTCDPGVVRIGAYYYVGYTSTEDSRGTNNDLYIARATSPAGPYHKWDGAGWVGAPQPIVTFAGNPANYGIGEPSLVLMGTRLFVYYSDVDTQGFTDVSIVEDATADDWPRHLVAQGHAITRRGAEDSTDVKYVDALARFVGVSTYDRFGPNASIGFYQSLDGVHFEPAPFNGSPVQSGAHNAGLSGSPTGHLDNTVTAPFIAYAYAPVGSAWGNWPTYIDPVTVGTVPAGAPVAGEVSSIVGTNDWNWSGPRARDGDPASVYSSVSHAATAAATEWVMLDLGAVYPLRGMTVVPRASGLGFPVDFTFETAPSSDGPWTAVPGAAHTGYPNPGGATQAFAFAASVSAQCVRLVATRLGADDNGNHYLQLAELSPLLAE